MLLITPIMQKNYSEICFFCFVLFFLLGLLFSSFCFFLIMIFYSHFEKKIFLLILCFLLSHQDLKDAGGNIIKKKNFLMTFFLNFFNGFLSTFFSPFFSIVFETTTQGQRKEHATHGKGCKEKKKNGGIRL